MTSVRIRNLWDLLSSSLWFLPSAMTVLAIAVAVGVMAADRSLTRVPEEWFFLYSGGAEGARSVLSTIAGSMITVAGVAFSATMVALSFASSELGPPCCAISCATAATRSSSARSSPRSSTACST